MSNIKFWNDFSPLNKWVYGILSSVLILSFTFMIVFWILGVSTIITWETALFSEMINTPITDIVSYPFSLVLSVDSITFNEYMQGSDLTLSEAYAYAFLLFFWVGIICFITISTYMSRIWYLVSSSLFIIIVMVIKPDLAFMIGNGNWVAGTMMLTFLGLSYYFQSFNKNVDLHRRLIAFSGLAILFSVIAGLFSNVEDPFLFLAAYGYPIPFILTIVAIFMVGHEIIAGLLTAVTRNASSNNNNWKHFFFISIIYLTNVALMYMNEINMIEWKLLPISPIFFFVISYIIGIWGFKQREGQYDYLFSFKPLGAIFYLAMGIIAFGTIGYILASGNDPAFEVIEDFVLYSQLGYGFVFLIYITSNFLQPISKGFAVHKIMYKPEVMPYFTFRLVGLIVFLALMFVVNWEIPFSQSISGYYNNLGDAHIFNKEETSARGYYTKGGQYSYSSHRSNYALAKMSIEEEKFEDALEFYNKAVSQRPTEYAYINLSNLYLSQNQYFEALFNLQEGLKSFPQSGPIKNNVGLLYARGNSLDSAIHYLKEAMNDGRSEKIAYNNIFNILAKTDISIGADSIEFKNENDWVNKVNRLAYLNTVKKPDNIPFVKPDSSINTLTHSYLYNVMINSLWSKDTTYFDQIKANEQGNLYFERRIKLAFALNRYFKGNVNSALQELKEISFGEPEWSGDIEDILGKIYLQLGDEKSAINYFAEAVDHGNEDSRLGLAMALTRSAKSENAITLWDSLSSSKNEELKNLSVSVLKMLKINTLEEALKLDDPQKYQFLIFNNFKFEQDLINSFKDLNYKAQALLLQASREYDLEHTQNAVQLYQKIKEIPVSESFVQNEMDILEMKIAALSGNIAVLESKLNNVQVSEGLRQYFLSQMLLIKGDSTGAESIFNKWADLNPYNEDMVILAYKFYEKKGENGKAYEILQRGASGNTFSVKLLKEYVKYCGRNGNTNFGYSALQEASNLLSQEDYNALYSEFEKGLEQWNSFTR